MKLRNKKTGETVKFVSIEPLYKDKLKLTYLLSSGLINERYYTSIEKFNDDWEDYKPTEPLIKDKKIRKAVRAWAEANDITEINVASSGYEMWGGIDDWCIHFGGNPFKDIKPLKYTIAELCGEEEE